MKSSVGECEGHVVGKEVVGLVVDLLGPVSMFVLGQSNGGSDKVAVEI